MSDGAEFHAELAINLDGKVLAGLANASGNFAGVGTADAHFLHPSAERRGSFHDGRFAKRELKGKWKVRDFGNDSLFRISHYANMGKKHARPDHYLREWREERKLTQEALADLVGTSKSVISELESSKKGLSNKWLARLAPVLMTTKGAILDYHPDLVDMEMLDHFLKVGSADRDQALKILKTFNKRVG
jgi:transcriptional regulator with XRE-family HTH domain